MSSFWKSWRPRSFLDSSWRFVSIDFFNFETTTCQMNSTFAAIIKILSIYLYLKLSFKIRMVSTILINIRNSSFRYSSTIINRLIAILLQTVSRYHTNRSMISLMKLIIFSFKILLICISLSNGCIIDILLIMMNRHFNSFS